MCVCVQVYMANVGQQREVTVALCCFFRVFGCGARVIILLQVCIVRKVPGLVWTACRFVSLRVSLRLAVVVVIFVILVVIVFSVSSASVVDVVVVTTARANDALLGKWNLCARTGGWVLA